MDYKEVYQRLVEIGNNYEASVRGANKEKLEDETIALKDAFMELYDCYDLNNECAKHFNKLMREKKSLEEDNERLRKMVQQIYEAFKKKALKYIVNSKMDTEDLNLFKEIFSTYLK